MSPADIYTLLIAIIVIQILVMAWLLDRLAESRKETEEAKDQERYWKRRAGQPYDAGVWETKP